MAPIRPLFPGAGLTNSGEVERIFPKRGVSDKARNGTIMKKVALTVAVLALGLAACEADTGDTEVTTEETVAEDTADAMEATEAATDEALDDAAAATEEAGDEVEEAADEAAAE